MTCSIIVALLPLATSKAFATESPYLDGVVPTRSAVGFTHPGVFVGLPQLEDVRRKIAEGQAPQRAVYDWLRGKSGSSLINSKPAWGVYSDAIDSSLPCKPDSRQGCVIDAGYKGDSEQEHTEAVKGNLSLEINSAYTNALLYYYSGGEDTYAQNAIRMLNAYGRSFRGFTSNPSNGHAGDLFAGWMSQTLVRAAEIIRYTYTPGAGEPEFDVAAFESMLRKAVVPRLVNGTKHVNNWRTSAVEGLMNIGIFLDDRAIYDHALGLWRDVTPAYIYVSNDGPRPASLLNATDAELDCAWINDALETCLTDPPGLPGLEYQNGQSLEICRDMWHASAGVGGIINSAETAWLQGDDLYGEQRTRVMVGLSYMLQLSQSVGSMGYPDHFCANAGNRDGERAQGSAFPTDWNSTAPLSVVVAYNHYATRQGRDFPVVRIPGYSGTYPYADPVAAYVADNRAGPTDSRGFVTSWQVLTHYGVGDGVPPSAPPFMQAPRATGDGLSTVGPKPPQSRSEPLVVLIGGFIFVTCAIAAAVVMRHRQSKRASSGSK